MKRKTLTIAISFFALIAIVSVGFASWVISRPETYEHGTGTITVESVDSSSTIKITGVEVSDTIVFGRPAKMDDIENAWLKSNAEEPENLIVTVTIKLSGKPGDTEEITLAAAADANASNFESAKTKNYVQNIKLISSIETSYDDAAAITKILGSEFTNVVGTNEYEASFKVAFKWGSAFKDENPYNYYNNLEYSAANAKDATDKLADLHTLLTGVNYKVTVKLPAKKA